MTQQTQSPQKRPPGLPPDTLIIKDGQVQLLSEWTQWNGMPCETIRIVRIADNQLRCTIQDPEHGGGTTEGPPDEILTRSFHPNIAAWYKYVFSLVQLIESTRPQGLDGYELKFVQVAKAA